MAEINYNNLYNQLNPMEKRYYDQQFSKNYVPGQENIMLSSQPAYEQMKAAYEAQQQIPEKSFLDSLNLFGSASAAEKPTVPNLSLGYNMPTFNLGTGITNTKAASPFINTADILNQYNVPNLRNQNLVDEIIAQNMQKNIGNFINAPQDYYPTNTGGITEVAPLQNLGIDTSYGVANEPDEEQVEYLGDKPKGGIADLLRTVLGFAIPGAGFLMNLPGRGLEGIRSLNQRLRNTTFGRSETLADYFQAKRDQKAREAAAARGAIKQQELARQTALQQMRSDDAYGGGGGGIGSSYGGSASPGSQGPGGSDEMGSF